MLPNQPKQKLFGSALREARISQLISVSAAQLHKLSDKDIDELRKQVFSYCDERLDGFLSVIQKESRIRQILAIPYSKAKKFPLDMLLKLINEIADFNDERINYIGKAYTSELRYLILEQQLQKQSELRWKKFFSIFKREEEKKNQIILKHHKIEEERAQLFSFNQDSSLQSYE